MYKQTDNFEAIAHDAVSALTAVVLTLKITGEDDFAKAVSEAAEKLIDRAIAIGGV